MQRFKCVELAASENSWGLARHLELIPGPLVTTVTGAEKRLAAAMELQERRLEEYSSKARRGGGGAG